MSAWMMQFSVLYFPKIAKMEGGKKSDDTGEADHVVMPDFDPLTIDRNRQTHLLCTPGQFGFQTSFPLMGIVDVRRKCSTFQ